MIYFFEAVLVKGNRNNGWTYIEVPCEIAAKLRKPGRIFVRGTVNGRVFQTTLYKKGDGSAFFYVTMPLQKLIGKKAGDEVYVEIKEDDMPRTVDVPEDLVEALSYSQKAGTVFENFPYSHKKEIVAWINDAKKPETRLRRIVKAVNMLENYTKTKK